MANNESTTRKRIVIKDLKDFFPGELANRRLISKYIDYVLNPFFQNSSESYINGFIGKKSVALEEGDFYLPEPTAERQTYQLSPVLVTSNENSTSLESNNSVVDFSNFLNTLKLQGCITNDQNRLLSDTYWSWCPPINIDMFLNYNFYYWVEEGQPPVELTLQTNAVADIIGQKNYTYHGFDEDENEITVEFTSGLRVMFINDANPEYNNIPFIVEGVGRSIQLIDDSEVLASTNKVPDYFVMERGCIDGNAWSRRNRWFHRSVLNKIENTVIYQLISDNTLYYTNASPEDMTDDTPVYADIDLTVVVKNFGEFQDIQYTDNTKTIQYIQAKKPILCFNKDIQLYNYGTYYRGSVDLIVDERKNDINGIVPQPIQGVDLVDGMTILITGDTDENSNNRIYQVSGVETVNTVILQPVINGLSTDGSPVEGEGIIVSKGRYNGTYYYYHDGQWITGQQKLNANQSPLFMLYDNDKIALDNELYYAQSSFEGNKLFDYITTNDPAAEIDADLNKAILTDGYGNYMFDNLLRTQTFTYYDYTIMKQYEGFQFFKLNGQDSYSNNWYISNDITTQYITTEITVTDDKVYETIGDVRYTVFPLAYQPDEVTNKKSSFVYLNGVLLNDGLDYIIQDSKLMIAETSILNMDDNLYIKLLVKKLDGDIAEGYFYDLPLTLTANAMNQDITQINYNECFDQLTSIIENQSAFTGNSSGNNNYNDTAKDLSLGTEILQHRSPALKTMLMNSREYTNIRTVMTYISTEYTKFKNKFKNIIKQMSNSGEYDEYETVEVVSPSGSITSVTQLTDVKKIVQQALSKINIGKQGLDSFYNNGVAAEYGECYIPATPAYLGLDCYYKPEIVVFEENVNKPNVLLCHDGSYQMLFGDYRDEALLEIETAIYNSILEKFKNAVPIYNKLEFIPGKFRDTDYSQTEYKEFLTPMLEKWCQDQNVDYTVNDGFDQNDPFTWNYSNCVDADGEQLYGSYRSIYMYYYDTFKPHEKPWEMLGFGSKPDWWDAHYGEAPYTSSNITMWTDIENGYIADGETKGEYEYLKRPGLFEKYLPVNEQGELLDPIEIGIVKVAPIPYYARQSWKVGDIGRWEFAWMYTSEYRYSIQTILYMMRPTAWLENNWDTENYKVLFKDTDYEQVIYDDLGKRPSPSDIYMHNELVDGSYVRKIGVQQWLSDFMLHENVNITNYVAQSIRDINMKLSYKCAGYYKYDSLKILSDNFGVIPDQNYEIDLYKTITDRQFAYSAMVFQKVENGYMIDGFDYEKPYFTVKTPQYNGRKSTVNIGGRNVIYYNEWTNNLQTINYKTVLSSIQDIYNIINGYGKYLEDEEGWYFNIIDANGELINFRSKSRDFLLWTTTNIDNGSVLILNPGADGIGIHHEAFIDKIGQYINGYWSILNTAYLPIFNESLDVYRQQGDTYIYSNDAAITSLKIQEVEHEHIILFDNETIYGDVIYDPLLCIKAQRLKLLGIKVDGWDGTYFAPGYLVDKDGAYPNYDKLANDFRYFYNTDDVRSQGIFGDYAKRTIGFQKLPSMERLLIDDRNIFDFYKGLLKEKGTKRSFGKLNRSTYIMNTEDNEIELYENWAFKLGEFGYTSNSSVIELKIQPDLITQNPQIVAFSTADNSDTNSSVVDIDWLDPNWLIQKDAKNENKFNFTDEFRFYPTAGFAQIGETNYIVNDEATFKETFENMQVGEKVWISFAATKQGWDIRKKINDTDYVSLVVDKIADVYDFDTTKLAIGDLIYVLKDVINNVDNLKKIYDPSYLINDSQNIIDRMAWSVFRFIDEQEEEIVENNEEITDIDYKSTVDRTFALHRLQNRKINIKEIKSCYMVNDDDNRTMVIVQPYDPLQGVIPNNLLKEVNYILAQDPVDYNNYLTWADTKVGQLWWDISKVKYLDYSQGEITYRRNNWGKQMPGSEIAIMEWTKSITAPTDGTKYITKEIYNTATEKNETYYYYWVKNPSTIPEVHFRHNSALNISKIINSPQEEGIVWFAPIYCYDGNTQYSALIIGNFDTLSAGREFVIQINFLGDNDVTEHEEWVMVNADTEAEIPDQLWQKMKDSLIGYDTLGQAVPDPELPERKKIGIYIRPRQTMFKDITKARQNFVDVVNDIFEHRDVLTDIDVGSTEFETIFNSAEPFPEYDYAFDTHLEMISSEDTALIGMKILVKNDEVYENIWTLWRMDNIGDFTLLQYQTYDVSKYWEYKDLYADESVELATPRATFESEIQLQENFELYNFEVGDIVQVYADGKWILKEYEGMQGTVPIFFTVGLEDGTINLTDALYSYMEDTELKNDVPNWYRDEEPRTSDFVITEDLWKDYTYMGINITRNGVLDSSYMKSSFSNNVQIYVPDESGEGYSRYPLQFTLTSGVSTPSVISGLKTGDNDTLEYLSNELPFTKSEVPVGSKVTVAPEFNVTLNFWNQGYDERNDAIYIGNQTKYEYLENETSIVIQKILEYFELD